MFLSVLQCTAFWYLQVEKEPYEEEDIFEESEMMNVGIVETTDNGGDAKKTTTHLDTKGTLLKTF